MEFRKSVNKDIHDIMNIIKEAQVYFKDLGINQWQNNYPNEKIIYDDILNRNSYVLLRHGEVVCTAVISFDGESTYNNIYEGQWLSHNDYAVIHRIAVSNKYKGQGLASALIKNAEELSIKRGVYSIRIDTHEENISMQRLLKKNGFSYCGVIFLKDGNKRIAFEKVLKN